MFRRPGVFGDGGDEWGEGNVAEKGFTKAPGDVP
jgi:hypothetical protein